MHGTFLPQLLLLSHLTTTITKHYSVRFKLSISDNKILLRTIYISKLQLYTELWKLPEITHSELWIWIKHYIFVSILDSMLASMISLMLDIIILQKLDYLYLLNTPLIYNLLPSKVNSPYYPILQRPFQSVPIHQLNTADLFELLPTKQLPSHYKTIT
jgi:hypothetical protein